MWEANSQEQTYKERKLLLTCKFLPLATVCGHSALQGFSSILCIYFRALLHTFFIFLKSLQKLKRSGWSEIMVFSVIQSKCLCLYIADKTTMLNHFQQFCDLYAAYIWNYLTPLTLDPYKCLLFVAKSEWDWRLSKISIQLFKNQLIQMVLFQQPLRNKACFPCSAS